MGNIELDMMSSYVEDWCTELEETAGVSGVKLVIVSSNRKGTRWISWCGAVRVEGIIQHGFWCLL